MKKLSRLPFWLIIAALLIGGVALSVHRHVTFEVPWGPGEEREIWEIQAQINLRAAGEAVRVDFALPSDQEGFRVLTEHTASAGYGLTFDDTPGARRARWAIRSADGNQQLYYTAQIMVAPNERGQDLPAPPVPEEVLWESPYDVAAQDLITQAWMRSADAFSFARELVLNVSGDGQGENARLLLTQFNAPTLVVRLLNQAGISAREVAGLQLRDGRRRQALTPYVQVYHDDEWMLIDPVSGQEGRPDDMMLWKASSGPVLQVEGATNSQVSFSMLQQSQPASAAVRGLNTDSTILNFSIHSLPLEEQALFMTILLIPIGALVVVMLRILVGIKTSGTFMPVLIALAFIQTSLLTGLVGFLLVVAVGLVIRSYLSHLNLLLVARVSAVIITVIGIISVFSVMSYRFGLNAGLTITFFPMIILSWTIERMSILWEEEGPKEVLIQGGGSLLTAIVAYLAMTNPWVRHITFNFLGVQLILMAMILMIGNYTGYRLLELRRFKPLSGR